MWNIRLSRDGRYLATTTQHNSKSGALVMDVSTGKRIFETAGRTSYWIRGLDLSDSLLAIGDELGGVVVWDINSKAALLDTNVGQVVQSVAISPDNKTLAVGLWDATIGLLQIAK
jgi:WD40 repeat protein